MDASSSAFLRALLAVGRAGVTGLLDVAAARRVARVGLWQGEVYSLAMFPPEDDALGGRLVRAGTASRGAVSRALRKQLVRRIGSIATWRGASYRFRPGSWDTGAPPAGHPARPSELVLSALRGAWGDSSWSSVSRVLGAGMVELTAAGEHAVRSAAMWPEEEAVVVMLRRGATAEDLRGALGQYARVRGFLLALHLIGALGARGRRSRSYGTLLRKHRQVRRMESAARLLGLPEGAEPAEARRALRRWAREVHPDRYDMHEAPAVRRASAEVMTALVRAEATVNR